MTQTKMYTTTTNDRRPLNVNLDRSCYSCTSSVSVLRCAVWCYLVCYTFTSSVAVLEHCIAFNHNKCNKQQQYQKQQYIIIMMTHLYW
mmetsp:Transcript_24019/g.26923  ORF Transcript_24019/g.26923 Transcript_24019/m.26923 type:complete len:88 (-) Transcript_24019:78-341(-)